MSRPRGSIIPPNNQILRIKLNAPEEWKGDKQAPGSWWWEWQTWFEEVVFSDPEWPDAYAREVTWTDGPPQGPTGDGLICEADSFGAKADDALHARDVIERYGFDMKRDFYGVATFTLVRYRDLVEARRQWKETKGDKSKKRPSWLKNGLGF